MYYKYIFIYKYLYIYIINHTLVILKIVLQNVKISVHDRTVDTHIYIYIYCIK